jgi:mono/diheme cytochrome c family protein
MSITARIAGGALGALLYALPAGAQETGNATAGKELASKLCSTCHIVGAERAGSDVAPPFPILAKDPGVTLTELHGWSGPMHPVLSNLALTAKQTADINAYLDSLRPGGEEEPLPAAGARAEEPPPVLENAPPERLGEPIEVTPE